MTNIYKSSVVNASAEELWTLIRDFNGLPNWLPIVANSRIEAAMPADQVGCVRDFRLQDGSHIREKLLALSDYDYSVSYSILESPMGIENYVATLQLIPITDSDRTFIQWQAEFDCNASDESALIDQIGEGVFQAGFNALKERFG